MNRKKEKEEEKEKDKRKRRIKRKRKLHRIKNEQSVNRTLERIGMS